jgi:hypothetical protein
MVNNFASGKFPVPSHSPGQCFEAKKVEILHTTGHFQKIAVF